jgi:hypothetical protein
MDVMTLAALLIGTGVLSFLAGLALLPALIWHWTRPRHRGPWGSVR